MTDPGTKQQESPLERGSSSDAQVYREALERIVALDKHTERLGYAQGIARSALLLRSRYPLIDGPTVALHD